MKEYQLVMTKTEIKPVSISVTDLQSAETVSSANATHFPPSGTALTITPSVNTPTVTALLGPFGLAGEHTVKIQAVGNNGSKPEVVYRITVIDL